MNKKAKVFVCYRVNQRWRAPLFKLLTSQTNFNFRLLISDDFVDSKVVSGQLDGISFHKFKSINIDISVGRKRLLLPYSIGLLRYLFHEKPSLVISEGRSNFINNSKCLIYALLFRKPFYQWGLGKLRKTSIVSNILAFPFTIVERLSTGAIAYSSIGREYYINVANMNPEKVHLAVNTIDDWNIPVSLVHSQPIERFSFLFVGAIEPQKKLDLLLKAFSLLVERYKRSELSLLPVLNIVGSGSSLNPCRELASKLLLTNKFVNFTGPLFGDQLKYYFDNSDLLVMPGLGGLVISESVCHGLPALCAMGDGSEVDWLGNGAGEMIDFKNAEVLSMAMEKYIINPNKIPIMSNKCRASRQAFSFDNYAEVFLQLIRQYV